MSRLLKLSTELLLAVLSHLPPLALMSLIHSCRRLHEIVIPFLYESVFFWGPGHLSSFCNNQFLNRQANLPSEGTRIRNLLAFTRSYLAYPGLQAYVKKVDLRWHKRCESDNDVVHQCLKALNSSYLQSLHLSPDSFLFDIPAGTVVTSLAFQYDGIRGGPEPCTNGTEFTRLYSLFCIPSLTHLCINDWPYWGPPSIGRPANVRADMTATSNIEHLELFQSGAPGSDLQEVLSWPKALRSFSFFAQPHDGLRYEGPSTISSRELHYCLLHQRRTLEVLEVDAADGNTVSDNTKPIVLNDFSALKRVCIRVDFIVLPSLDYEQDYFIWEPHIMPTNHLVNALPTTLEDLRLNATEMFYSCRPGDDEHESGVQDLLSWLGDVAASKLVTLLALKTVGYTPSHFYGSDDGRHDARLEEVERAYMEANVALYGYDE